MKTLFPDYSSEKVRHLLESTVQAACKLKDYETRREFYSQIKDIDTIGEFCSQLELTCSRIYDITLLPECWKGESPPKLTNGAMIELYDLCKKDNAVGLEYLGVILNELAPEMSVAQDLKSLEKEIKSVRDTYIKLNKSKSRNGNAGHKLLTEHFVPKTMTVTSDKCASKDSVSKNVQVPVTVPTPPQSDSCANTDSAGTVKPEDFSKEILLTIQRLEREIEMEKIARKSEVDITCIKDSETRILNSRFETLSGQLKPTVADLASTKK